MTSFIILYIIFFVNSDIVFLIPHYYRYFRNFFGLWRSLVAHYAGGVGVPGSNPGSPTILCFKKVWKFKYKFIAFISFIFFITYYIKSKFNIFVILSEILLVIYIIYKIFLFQSKSEKNCLFPLAYCFIKFYNSIQV